MKKWFKINDGPSDDFNCEIRDCYLKNECANHESSGLYRYEGGHSPELKTINDRVCCSKKFQREGSGFVSLDDNDKPVFIEDEEVC